MHPLARVLTKSDPNSEISKEVMNTLYVLVTQLEVDYVIFIPMFYKIMNQKGIKETTYEQLISKLLKNESIKEEASAEKLKNRLTRSASIATNKTLNMDGVALIKIL